MSSDILMSLPIPLALMLAGIFLLIKGGNWTVDAAVYVAERFGLSPLVVGFTIVAFGTSLPELVISVIANFQGSTGIALGNVIGSNIANVFLVIGVTAVFVPLISTAPAIFKDVMMMIFVTFLLCCLLFFGEVGRLAGFGMIVLLIGYVFYQYTMAKSGELPVESDPDEDPVYSKPWFAYAFLVAGLVCVALGAELLVRGAQQTAGILGVPEAVIALSIIALGTSLPELSTCLIAGRKGHSDIVLGNIIGSNVFNVLMILGITALVKPIVPGSYAEQLINFDIWVAAFAAMAFAFLIVVFGKVTRVAGIIFCLAYLAYNIYIYAMHFPG